MIQLNKILDRVLPLVGHEQPASGFPIVSDDNLLSTSGLTSDQIYEYSGIQTVKELFTDKDASDEDINNKIESLKKVSIINFINDIFKDKRLISAPVYPNPVYANDNQTPVTGQFNGFKVDMSKAKDYSVVINSITTEFISSQTLTLKLLTPTKEIYSKDLTITGYGQTFDLDWVLDPYISKEFYIGYFASSGEYRNRSLYDSNTIMCFNHFRISPATVPGTSISDFRADQYQYDQKSLGLNFDVSVHQDWTYKVFNNLSDFANIYALRYAVDMCQFILQSDRSNLKERYAKAKVLTDLNGFVANDGRPISTGLLGRYNQEVKRLKDRFVNEPKIIVI